MTSYFLAKSSTVLCIFVHGRMFFFKYNFTIHTGVGKEPLPLFLCRLKTDEDVKIEPSVCLQVISQLLCQRIRSVPSILITYLQLHYSVQHL